MFIKGLTPSFISANLKLDYTCNQIIKKGGIQMARVKDTHLVGWRNVRGDGQRTCPCGTWRNHWINYSGATMQPYYCAVEGCNNRFDRGGHMYYGSNKKEYIVPICHECNMSNNVLTLKSGTYVAIANMSETCKK